VNDLVDRAEKVVRDVTEAGRGLAESAAVVALETADRAHLNYRRRTRITYAVGGVVITVLAVALARSRR
jgi:hypothetical protein